MVRNTPGGRAKVVRQTMVPPKSGGLCVGDLQLSRDLVSPREYARCKAIAMEL